MNYTVDASVALKLLLNEPGSDEVRSLMLPLENGRIVVRDAFSAPALIGLEVHNTLTKAFHKTIIDMTLIASAAGILRAVMSFQDLDSHIVETAREMSVVAHSWSGQKRTADVQNLRLFNIYGCVYIAHAKKYGTTLLTADATQRDVAHHAFAVPVRFISLSVS